MPNTLPVLAFIGAGNMAQAIIKGLLQQGYEANKIIATGRTSSKLQVLSETTGISVSLDNQDACQQADIIILGVKPQMMQNTIQALSDAIDPQRHLIISVAAGVLAESINGWLGKHCATVRCMPNTPSLVGMGASGLHANELVSSQQKSLAEQIMQAVGICIWLEDEQLIDAVTAVSGSGPAYYFLMMEAMITGAQELGLNADQAQALVLQTAAGAAVMAQQSSHSPEQLRLAVTSPMGTTEQALNSFAANNYQTTVTTAMQAAYHRSQELAQAFKS
ncbi:MAG: pyrroline-5-carboxylate reductase [Gammaproteobacteria bacterium]|jgi:pyrroline-5-carboxylate reductase|nr:pyrroline-5-carboxylate reductase [Gammaproteobacteria bacterium]MCP4881356.1 pyrroline-5-carboxylate reductase [Gammaproteobacteria bacterium]